MEHSTRAAADRAHRAARRVDAAARSRPLSEGFALIGPLLAVALVAAGKGSRVLSALVFAAAALIAFAFRDPGRPVAAPAGIALAPADGRVLHVERVWDAYWQTEMLEVAIFLALWDVHVQRVALAGEVVAQERRAGGYRPAMSRAATHGNNQLATFIQTADGPCTVTQISGLVARRIVSWVEPGDTLQPGERLGMIKFGSQVTLRVAASATPLVAPGDHVIAGVTEVARLAPVDESASV